MDVEVARTMSASEDGRLGVEKGECQRVIGGSIAARMACTKPAHAQARRVDAEEA